MTHQEKEPHMAISTRATYDVDIADVEYLRHGDKPLLARLFKPRGSRPFPTMVELHGGVERSPGLDRCHGHLEWRAPGHAARHAPARATLRRAVTPGGRRGGRWHPGLRDHGLSRDRSAGTLPLCQRPPPGWHPTRRMRRPCGAQA